jgi:hypothetical protein
MPNLEDYFGVNIDAEFNAYIDSEAFQAWLDEHYPGTDAISFALLNNDFRSEWNWRNPLNRAHTLFSSVIWGDVATAMAPDGTMENVGSKLRFVLREGKDSVEAETLKHLVQPGDFPWQGAGTYRGFTGGVSGRTKREDWLIFCHLVDHLISLMDQVATLAGEFCDAIRNLPGCPRGLKYSNVTALKRGFDPLMSLREFLGDSDEGQHAVEILVDQAEITSFAVLYFMAYTGHIEQHHLLTDEDRLFIEQCLEDVKFAFAA